MATLPITFQIKFISIYNFSSTIFMLQLPWYCLFLNLTYNQRPCKEKILYLSTNLLEQGSESRHLAVYSCDS